VHHSVHPPPTLFMPLIPRTPTLAAPQAYRPFSATAAILVAYLTVMHLLSFAALLKVARKERR
jgi:hypothetical protein